MKRNFLVLLAIAFATPSLAAADLPAGAFYSDHDAHFELENTRSGREDTGWYLNATALVYGNDIPAESMFKYVVKQGRRTLAEFRCTARLAQRHLGYDIREGRLGNMSVRGACRHRDDKLQVVGDITVEVYFVDGSNDAETLMRTHTLAVRSYERANNSREYYIEHNGFIAATIVHECPRNGAHGCISNADDAGEGYVGVFMWLAETRANHQSPRVDAWGMDMTQRCSVDGQRVQTTRHDAQPSTVRGRTVNVQASSGEGRPADRDRYQFKQFHVMLPISVGEEQVGGMARLEDHSGQWECEIRRSGTTVRTVRFRSADGHILPHAEEASANFRLPPGAHLAEVVIPADAALETRVTPDGARLGPFFGVGWATDEGRALGTSLPTIGTAQLAGQPRARRRRRGRRGRR